MVVMQTASSRTEQDDDVDALRREDAMLDEIVRTTSTPISSRERLESESMMDGSKLIELLGHASTHPELDDFLSQNGVKVRPKGGDTPNLVSEKKLGLSFEYRAQEDFEQSVGKPRSSGKFILREVDFSTDKVGRFATFAGEFPFGVSFATSESGLESVFGAPRESLAGDDEDGPNHVYCVQGLIVVAQFSVGGKSIEWLRVGLPTNADRDQGLCP
jgi:hypothetical protein